MCRFEFGILRPDVSRAVPRLQRPPLWWHNKNTILDGGEEPGGNPTLVMVSLPVVVACGIAAVQEQRYTAGLPLGALLAPPVSQERGAG